MKKEDINQSTEHENKKNEVNRPATDSDYDKLVFVPAENIQAIERVIKNWEEVKHEWNKLKIASDDAII